VRQPKPKKDETASAQAESSAGRQKALAKLAGMPSVQAGATIREYDREVFGTLQSLDLAHGVQEKIVDVHEGNLNIVTDMLVSQAHALDAVFHSMARRAANNEQRPNIESCLGLALKAQAQCRATLETLAMVKNPQPRAFIRQQNIAVNQQVNNGQGADSELKPVKKTVTPRTALLEDKPAAWLDTGVPRITPNANQHQTSAVATANNSPDIEEIP